MASYREEEDPFEEDIVFDQAGLLTNTTKMNTAIRRVSSGKCTLFAKTLGLCGAFFGLGLCIAIPGPTFLSPITELQADTLPISSIYAARSTGYLIGSIIGGILFDHFNRLFLLFISLLLTAIFITVTPWCHVLWLLETCMVFLGMTMGFLDTGGNVLCLDLWGRNSGPFMQALHFSFGLGAFVAPLLAAPFLEPSTIDVLPTTVVSTALPFQIADQNDMERGKRETLLNESFAGLINNTDFSANILFEFTTKSLENVSMPSSQMNTAFPVSTPSNLLSYELNTTDSLDANETTVQPIVTTQRIPKRKPSKTNASSLGNVNWDKIRVGTPPKEDLEPIPSTTSKTITSTITAQNEVHVGISTQKDLVIIPSTKSSNTFISGITEIPTTAAVSSTFKSSFKGLTLKQPLMLRSNETTTVIKETNTNSNPINNNTDVESFGSTNEENTGYSKSKMALPESNSDVNSTSKSSIQSIIKNTDSEWTKNMLNNNIIKSSINFTVTTPKLVIDSINVSHSEEEIVSKFSLPSYMSYSQDKATLSYEASLETQEYLPSKIQKEIVPSFDAEITRSHVKLSTNIPRDHDIQSVTELASNIMSEKHKEISNNEKPISSLTETTWNDRKGLVTSVLDPIPTENSLPKHIHHFKPLTYDNDTEVINSIFNIVANRIEKYGFSKVQFTYLMVGLFVFAISLVFLGFLCHNPRDPKSKQEEGHSAKKISNKALHGLLISLMAIFFLMYVGLEVTYGQLVLAFAVHGDLQLARSTGVVIAVVFWGSFAAMRFASIFFSSGFGPITMLLLNFVFCTLGTILLSTMASHTETALWVGTTLLGIGLASIFPTGILWIERYIHVSNKVAAAFVMGASLGEMVCPIAVYRLMVNNPAMLMHSAVVINILCIVTFIALWWLALRHGEKYCAASNNGYQLANQDEEEDMIDMSPSGSVIALRRHSFSSEHRALLNGNPHRGP